MIISRLSAVLRAGLIAFLLLSGWLGSAFAQDISPDYEAWGRTVQRVERVLEANRAKDETLERLRSEIAEYRDLFLDAESVNDARLQRVARQLDTLGPPPPEGETELQEVATRRAALNSELRDLRLPAIRASEAYVEADGLVAEIDALLRDRQADQVLTRVPPPINLLNWRDPILEARKELSKIATEVEEKVADNEIKDSALNSAPAMVLAALLGTFLIFRTRYYTGRADRRIDVLRPPPLQSILRLINAMVQLVLPWIGLSLLLASLQLSGIFGPTGSVLLISLSTFGFVMITGFWLVRQLYPLQAPDTGPMRIDAKAAPAARRQAFILVCALSFHQGVVILVDNLNLGLVAEAYAGFTVSLITAASLYRTAQLFRRSIARQSTDASDADFSNNVLNMLSFAAMVLCILAPLAGLAGFVTLAKEAVYSAAWTYLLFGLMALSQRALGSFYGLVTKSDTPSVQDGLVPTLIGMVLILVSIPLIALLWGARVTDLTELWSRLREGFKLGDVQISPTEFLAFLLVFGIGYGLTRLLQGALRTTILPKTGLDLGARTAFVSGIGYIGVFIAALVAVTTAGIDLSNLAILASALAVGIGFGLQTIVSNFVSGIILLIERPVSEGDWIEVAGQSGYVRRISVRSTRIETFDRTDVILPNSDLVSGVVTNWTRGNLIGRLIVPVGVAYGTDTRKVERILSEIANAHPMVVISPPPSILLVGLGASSVDFEIRVILRDINFMLGVRSEMYHEIVRRFAEEGIEIPFPQQDVWLRGEADGQGAAAEDLSRADEPAPDRALQRDDISVEADGGDSDR